MFFTVMSTDSGITTTITRLSIEQAQVPMVFAADFVRFAALLWQSFDPINYGRERLGHIIVSKIRKQHIIVAVTVLNQYL